MKAGGSAQISLESLVSEADRLASSAPGALAWIEVAIEGVQEAEIGVRNVGQGVLLLVIYINPTLRGFFWECHWRETLHNGYAPSIERAKSDAKEFGLVLLQRAIEQLKQLGTE